MIQTQVISYNDGSTALSGWLATDNTLKGKRPVVLVAHDWSGRNEFACKKAEALAAMGYAGFAIDMYGNATTGQTDDEKMELMKPLISNRPLLFGRIRAAVEAVKKIPEADHHRIAAIGFCFGGLCVLDLARGSSDIKGVVSLHGLLHPTGNPSTPIQTKILVLHGHDDPSVLPEQVLAFENEMTSAKADWQVMIFGGTVHAFTNPLAADPVNGRVYSPTATHRAWNATKNFLTDIFTE